LLFAADKPLPHGETKNAEAMRAAVNAEYPLQHQRRGINRRMRADEKEVSAVRPEGSS
jgi:hypothetical protein